MGFYQNIQSMLREHHNGGGKSYSRLVPNMRAAEFLTTFCMQELSAEKFISNLDLSGNLNLSENCAKDLEILSNGTKTFFDNVISTRQFGKRDIDTKLIIPVIDACGKLSPGILRGRSRFIGSFEECMAIDYYDAQALRRIRGGYFRVLLQIPIANSTTNFMWDVCLPASCTGKELHTALADGSLPLVGKYIAEVIDGFEKIPKYVTASYIVGVILLLTIAICIVAGIVDYYNTNVKKQQPKGLGYTILMNFSLYKNCKYVIALTPAKKGQISTLNCIRAVSMIWIITGHTFSISMAAFGQNREVQERVVSVLLYNFTHHILMVPVKIRTSKHPHWK
ncbi:unnamed protein product [Cylicocyclus nassatus]|uniref:Nose resistant-to-fluoxetine protein N-terminal domain-containing protein n=1 Tax=Cylicocyclus nassatus TaxID=53992 RepID=A0AA36DKI0_CYLNA|nr:unnamed protein product [Cylicocyclus nassatus]